MPPPAGLRRAAVPAARSGVPVRPRLIRHLTTRRVATRLFFALRHSWTVPIALVLSFSLLSACASRTIEIPTLPPATEDISPDDPARHAQRRLLVEAHRAFSQARYPAAVLFFTRFIERSPDSPHVAEARWWLGRAQEQVGDFAAAMAQYRILAAGPWPPQSEGARYEAEALRRLDELRQRPTDRVGPGRPLAIRVAAGSLPPPPLLAAWLTEQTQAGATALIVDPARGGTPALADLVTEAHRAGLALWVSVDVHQPQLLDVKPEWLAQTAGRRTSEEAILRRPDIAHAGYQAALVELVRGLSESGCDGLFVPARPVPGFAREYSPESFAAFAAAFGVNRSPEQVLGGVAAPAPAPDEAEYWRWAGWKASAYAKLAAGLRTALRNRHPTPALLIEVHQASLSAPVEGLEHYGEDVTGLAQGTGASIVVRRDGTGGEASIERLREQLGPSERVWLELPLGAARGTLADVRAVPSDTAGGGRWPTIVTLP